MKYLISALVTLAALGTLATAQNVPEPIDFGETETLTIVSDGTDHTFTVEVADTLEEQARGLMYRDSLAPDAGMLFEFAEPKVATIWMKNTSISLDILFVRSNGKILKIEHLARPYSLRNASSEAEVAAVIELAGGQARERGIMPGDQVIHDFFQTETESSGN